MVLSEKILQQLPSEMRRKTVGRITLLSIDDEKDEYVYSLVFVAEFGGGLWADECEYFIKIRGSDVIIQKA